MAPLSAFSLNYKQACAATCSLLHYGTVAMYTIPGGNSAHDNTKNVDSGHVNTFNVNTIVK
ncbi:hypothetical protein DSO57_1018025 [Entomophthora muscae]|uniref:Uncharacterized protein n=1 Tax=Entomophthora muscae TaxID=34485 RepID=A0ACC2UDW5_9FUNG|nr:hypothetical protein DSO57_1018025 [Entomophthora muscae]